MVKENAFFLSRVAISCDSYGTPKWAAALLRRRVLIRGLTMSAIGISAPRGKGFAVSASADIRHDQLVFERQQSLALREREWEDRVQPLLPWSALIMRGLGVTIFAAAILAILI
jgi:hypothetical protein